jgi:hypothetical protein
MKLNINYQWRIDYSKIRNQVETWEYLNPKLCANIQNINESKFEGY